MSLIGEIIKNLMPLNLCSKVVYDENIFLNLCFYIPEVTKIEK